MMARDSGCGVDGRSSPRMLKPRRRWTGRQEPPRRLLHRCGLSDHRQLVSGGHAGIVRAAAAITAPSGGCGRSSQTASTGLRGSNTRLSAESCKCRFRAAASTLVGQVHGSMPSLRPRRSVALHKGDKRGCDAILIIKHRRVGLRAGLVCVASVDEDMSGVLEHQHQIRRSRYSRSARPAARRRRAHIRRDIHPTRGTATALTPQSEKQTRRRATRSAA
jgi:hypothetical protein